MEYIVFPFGKYKGVKIEDLPSTYIVLALESFDLPGELQGEMACVLYGRLRVFSLQHKLVKETNKKDLLIQLENLIKVYEKNERLD